MTFPRVRVEHCLSWMYTEFQLLFGFTYYPLTNPKFGGGARIQIDIYKYCFTISFLLDYKKYDAYMAWRNGGWRKKNKSQ